MKFAIRICLYVLLAVIAVTFLSRFRRSYLQGIQQSQERALAVNAAGESGTPDTTTNALPAAVGETNSLATNLPVALGTNSNSLIVTNAGNAGVPAQLASSSKADAFIYLGVFVAALLGLGGLGAWELSQYLGNRAGRAVMAEGWVERKDPEYEKAEEEWAKGNHLDAIGLMREYLKKNPSEQHVALRIAEVYEKDLGNYLAAALEIEEILTKKLPREKWGWTAVRLSNLYSGRLNQSAKAIAILERIVHEYGETGAAKKARQRLGIPEPEVAAAEVASEATDATDSSAPAPSSPPTPEPPASNLPKGFRPKK